MLFNKLSMNSNFLKRIALFIFIGLLTLLMIKVKIDHIVLWDSIYQSQNVAANPDADYQLKLARDLIEQEFKFTSIIQATLLPLLIALISRSAEIKDLIWAGNLLTPICCALTFLAIGLFFSIKSNFSPWGWVVSFLSLLTSYLCLRTGPGYIDTDLLNVFFVYLISALIYFQTSFTNIKDKYYLTFIIGVLNFLFIRWYQHEGFTILFSLAIFLTQWQAKESWKDTLRLLILFIFLSSLGGSQFFDSAKGFINVHFSDQWGASKVTKSGVAISELAVSGYKEWPHILFEWRYHWALGLVLVLLSSIGNLFWIFEDKKKLFAYFIPYSFIPLSFFMGDRFYIYTIPLFWFGLFHIIKILIIKIRVNEHVSALIAITLMSSIFFLHYPPRCFFIFDKSCNSKVTLFSFPTNDVINATTFTNSNLIERNNTLLAWWDYGYYLALHTKFNLVLNNGNPFNIVTSEFVDAVFVEDEAKAHQKLKDLTQHTYILRGELPVQNKIYLLVNQDLLTKIPDFYRATSIEKIKAHARQSAMKFIFCNKKNAYEMTCNQDVINYKFGLINQAPNFYKIIYVDHSGKFLKEKIFNENGQDILVTFSTDKQIGQGNIIVPRWVADTTLMKLYLGQFDPKFFKLVYNHFPEAKIYELN